MIILSIIIMIFTICSIFILRIIFSIYCIIYIYICYLSHILYVFLSLCLLCLLCGNYAYFTSIFVTLIAFMHVLTFGMGIAICLMTTEQFNLKEPCSWKKNKPKLSMITRCH